MFLLSFTLFSDEVYLKSVLLKINTGNSTVKNNVEIIENAVDNATQKYGNLDVVLLPEYSLMSGYPLIGECG